MKQLHKNRWLLIGLILITIFSSLGNSMSVIAETLDSSIVKSTIASEEENSSEIERTKESFIEETSKKQKETDSDSDEITSLSSSLINSIKEDDSHENISEGNAQENNIQSQRALDFPPPARGNIGSRAWTVGCTSVDAQRKYLLNTFIPSAFGKEIQINAKGKLGSNVGDTIELSMSRDWTYHYFFDWVNNTGSSESWYGRVRPVNVKAKTSSPSISAKAIQTSNKDWKIIVTRIQKGYNTEFEVEVNYDFQFDYYSSDYFGALPGADWTDWMGHQPVTVTNITSSVKIEATPSSPDLGNSIVLGQAESNDNGSVPFAEAFIFQLNGNILNPVVSGIRPDNVIDYKQGSKTVLKAEWGVINNNRESYFQSYIPMIGTGMDTQKSLIQKWTGVTGVQTMEVHDGSIIYLWSNMSMNNGSTSPRIQRTKDSLYIDDNPEKVSELYYQIYGGEFHPLSITKLKSPEKVAIKKDISESELDDMLRSGDSVLNFSKYPKVSPIKFKTYPKREMENQESTAVIQVGERTRQGANLWYDYTVNFKVENTKLSAKPNSQEITLGEKIIGENLVTNVKLGNQTLTKDEYTVSIQNTVSTDTVGDKTAKVLITYKKDTSKTLTLDVPVNVLWGNSIVYGGYDYAGSGRTTASFTLNNGDNPFITAAQGGTRDDNLAIHSNFPDELYYTFNWFDLSSKQTFLMKEEQNGTSYIQANGNELKKDKLKQWGTNQKQVVNYGDVVRAWQVETGKNWLYENEQKNFYNKGNQSVYYEITKTGYKPLTFNQATINKRTISIDESDKEIENKIAESIELPTGVTAKFIEYPNREKQGDAQGLIRVSQKLESGKTIEYDYIVPFEVINDRLNVETKEADIFLGTNIDSISPNTFIKSVKLGEQKLKENEYKVEYVKKPDTSIIGQPEVNLKITLNSNSNKFVEANSKANIKYGSTIISRAYKTGGVDVSVSLLDKQGEPYLNANQGFGFDDYHGGLLSRPKMSIFRNNDSNNILGVSYESIKNSRKKIVEKWNQSFESVDLEYGDVVAYSVKDYEVEANNSKGYNTWISRNDSLVRETQGYNEAYYELTKDGYRLMNINQLVVNNSNKIPLNISQEEMDENVMDFISIPSHISNPKDYRMEFESVDTSTSGKKTSTIKVYQRLQSGGEFMTTYSVNYTVNPEIEETDYDVEGNKISETKKTSFDYGTQFIPSPTKYLEKEGILYAYKGWLEENEVPGIDTPRKGIPEPTKTESKLNYIYEKADKYISVTIPTEIVFGTFDNTEVVKSKKYGIKNNSKEFTTNVSLESFREVKTSVKLLGEKEAPDETKDSARLNLLINDEPKIKGLNETKRNISLADIEPESTANMGIDGEYYAKTSKINIVQYKTILKFKAVSGK